MSIPWVGDGEGDGGLQPTPPGWGLKFWWLYAPMEVWVMGKQYW